MAITSALSEAAYGARWRARPEPVIVTDVYTARALANEIARELGDPVFFDRVQMPEGVIAMFDGVQIRTAKPRVRVKMVRG